VNKIFISIVALMSFTLIGCNGAHTVVDKGERALFMANAEHMPIIQTKVRKSESGEPLKSTYVTCVAPSPDIATAISKSFQLAAEASAKLPQNVDPKLALAMSRSQTESIAQLGERIATIQLLRDGLYRACEAFANGAISETAYAVMLSRYDDTMVTLLATDLAAGAFGRSLAGIDGEAEGKAKSEGDHTLKVHERVEAEKKLEQEINKKLDLDTSIGEAQAIRDNQENALERAKLNSASDAELVGLQANLEQSEKRLEELKDNRTDFAKNIQDAKREAIDKIMAETESKAKGSVTVGGPIPPGQQSAEIAKVIHEIQRKYIENINSDAISTACIVAMSKADENPLAKKCASMLEGIKEKEERKLAEIKNHSEMKKARLETFASYQKVIDELIVLQKKMTEMSSADTSGK